MRHSTLELTGRYTRPRPVDLEQAVGLLPSLSPGNPASEAGRATGTEGPPIGISLARHLPTEGDGRGRDLSVPVVLAGPGIGAWERQNPGDFGPGRPLPVTGGNSGGGIRTPDKRLMNPLL